MEMPYFAAFFTDSDNLRPLARPDRDRREKRGVIGCHNRAIRLGEMQINTGAIEC